MTEPDRATLTLMMTFAINWAQMLAEDAKTTREAERNVARFRKLQAKLIAQPHTEEIRKVLRKWIADCGEPGGCARCHRSKELLSRLG
jgi:hypothetical protein